MPSQFTLKGVERGYFIGVWRDELEVPTVQLWRLRKASQA